MLKFVSYDILFSEIPDEVSLAVSISGCPLRCAGCHSAHLRESVGRELSCEALSELLERYSSSITCLCFMGGDAEPSTVEQLAEFARCRYGIKCAWYSGRSRCAANPSAFDYIKLGEYRAECGGLDSRTTNQRMYRVQQGHLHDITERFWR